jgi:Fe2+ or Zn2+ uptake regulation protein
VGCSDEFKDATPKGFAVESHEVYLFGRCEDCKSA